MSKHTPGPWFINRESEDVIEGKLSIESVNAETQLSYFIAQVDECKSQEANARLIAAAPELLEALESAVTQMRIAYECVEAGRYDEALIHLGSMPRQRANAIAKATGASQ